MKKSLLALAATSALTVVHADDSSITLYGIVDLAIGHVQHSLSADPSFGNTVSPLSATSVSSGVTAMINGGISDSRLGFRGIEDLGGGRTAFFTLESGFNAQDGQLNNAAAALQSNSPTKTTVSSDSSLNGQFFNRQSFVGLSDPTLGSVSFGRVYNPIYDVVSVYDPVQAAQNVSPLGISSTYGAGGGISEDARLDNAVKYRNRFGDVNFSALYKIGGVAGNSKAGSAVGLNLGYESGPIGIQAVYEQFTDAVKLGVSTVAGQVTASVYDTSAWLIAGKYKFGPGNLKAGYESYTLKSPSNASSVSTLGLPTYGYTTSAVTAGIKAGAANQNTKVAWIGGDYDLAPTTNLAAGAYTIRNGSGLSSGAIYAYSLLLDHNLSKRTDIYAGLLYAQYKGTAYAAPTNANNSAIAVGVRHRF